MWRHIYNIINTSLKTKLIVLLLAGIIIPVTITSLISQNIYNRIIQNSAIKISTQYIDQMANEVENFMSIINNVAYVTTEDFQVQEKLSPIYDGQVQLNGDMSNKQIEDSLYYTQKFILKESDGISIVGENGIRYKSGEGEWKEGNLRTDVWYNHLLSSDVPSWFQLRTGSFARQDKSSRLISMGMPIMQRETREKIGVILIDINQKRFTEKFRDNKLGQTGTVVIFDAAGNQISPLKDLANADEVFASIFNDSIKNNKLSNILMLGNETKNIVIYKVLSSDWKVAGIIPMQELFMERDSANILIFLITSIICVFAALLGVRISGSITSPINKLQKAMKKVQLGDFSVILEQVGQNEIGALTKGFNVMIRQINELMIKMKDEQISLEQERFRVLQAQINPHFLYNTLGTVVWLSKEGRNEDVITTVTSMIRIFRIALNGGNDFISILEESDHVYNYLTIQQIRFVNLFTFSINIENAIESCITNKLILQPIVENAVYHGLQPSSKPGHISIIGYSIDGDTVVFEISDNGVGMTEKTLATLIEVLEGRSQPGKSGYGLYNINKRIQFLFGSPYGVSVFSTPGLGTNVRITIPLIKDGDNYVKGIDRRR